MYMKKAMRFKAWIVTDLALGIRLRKVEKAKYGMVRDCEIKIPVFYADREWSRSRKTAIRLIEAKKARYIAILEKRLDEARKMKFK